MAVYSATYAEVEYGLDNLYLKQMTWFGIGFVGMLIVAMTDYHFIAKGAYIFYAMILIALLLVLIIGRVTSGSQRWLSLGGFSFQPSELAKFVMILVLARYYDSSRLTGPRKIRHILIPACLVLIPVFLIIKQPDLGTALVLIFLFLSLTFIAGLSVKSVASLSIMGLLAFPFFWSFLKDYQKTRILTLLNPDNDPLGSGYHGLQSKIAIGSGKIFGKGIFGGTQSRLNFLPEKHTDFIFSVFAEETGFVGVVILLVLYFLLLMKGVDIASRSKDRLGAFLAAGVVCVLTFSIFVNIGMAIGIAPVVGLPLPFLSYGGSAVVTSLLGIGLLLNVGMRKFE